MPLKTIPDYSGMTVEEAIEFDPDFLICVCFAGDECDPHVEGECGDPHNHSEETIEKNHEACAPGTPVPTPHNVGVYLMGPD